MKKWTGGSVIVILTLLLFLRYSLLPLSPSLSARAHRGPHRRAFRSLPGFTSLFAHTNGTHPNQLIWPHMLSLLSRPASLPATADGVKEASFAWTSLVSDTEISPVTEKDGNGSLNCPFSVGGNGSLGLVEIPCGFVQDSAVTVVGVPVGKNGSGGFWIELVGDRGAVVLIVNVSVGGDEVGLKLNSWSEERGWGEWEWCPGRRQSVNDSELRGTFCGKSWIFRIRILDDSLLIIV